MAFLFDLDGVIVDTEPQYSIFWDKVGNDYLHDSDHFGMKIKGNTLRQIFERHFAGHDDWQKQIASDLLAWERAMRFDLIPGIEEFLNKVREAGISTSTPSFRPTTSPVRNPTPKDTSWQLIDWVWPPNRHSCLKIPWPVCKPVVRAA